MEQKNFSTQGGSRSNWKGWFEIDGKRMYLKSLWEKRYCQYLSLLKQQGEIKDYWYEAEVFWFEGIMRGTNNYKPDFKIEENSGIISFVEVKGYTTPKDKTKWKRMAKYHPQVKLRIIDGEWFKKNNKAVKVLIREWD